MKLRFEHQSLRLRVRKSDVAMLSQAGFIEETVRFPAGLLVYRLEINPDAPSVSAAIAQQTITVSIPKTQASAWIHSEAVGIYASLDIEGPENLLEILIEKDFPCKHGSTADNADSFEELSKL